MLSFFFCFLAVCSGYFVSFGGSLAETFPQFLFKKKVGRFKPCYSLSIFLKIWVHLTVASTSQSKGEMLSIFFIGAIRLWLFSVLWLIINGNSVKFSPKKCFLDCLKTAIVGQ